MPTVYSDLSGIFYIQQQYLADLAAISSGDTGAPVLRNMQELRRELNTAYDKYYGNSNSSSAVLDRQANMKQIIDNELNRLNDKKSSVDSALYGQKRMADFSSSYSKKYFAQIKILFIVIIILLIYLGLTLLNNFIPVPSVVFIFVMSVVGIFGFVIIAMTLKDINRRYNMDFDKLNLNQPSRADMNGGDGNTTNGSLGGLLCVGEACCPVGNTNGSIWDGKTQQCLSINIPGGVSGFTLMDGTKSGPSTNAKRIVNPYEPSEINSYSKI
jgi:hypothetical protein